MSPLEAIKRLELLLADLGENLAVASVTEVEEAHEIVEAAEQFRRSVVLVIEAWRAREIALIEAGGGRVDLGINATIRSAPKFRDRYDHDLIGRHVITHATKQIEDGEVLFDIDDPVVAADRAVALMRSLYVSPATEPKKGALRDVGFEKPEGALASRDEVGRVAKVRPT